MVRFKKKLTVIGIIGHTQGVIRAIKPAMKPAMKIYQPDCDSELSSPARSEPYALSSLMTGVQRGWLDNSLATDAVGVSVVLALATAVAPDWKENSSRLGGVHIPSLQLIYTTSPEIVYSPDVGRNA